MISVDRVLCFDYPRRELAVSGWASLDKHTAPDELWVECDGARSPALSGLPRPDVARYYDAPSLSRAGFLSRFPVARDRHSVVFIARHKGAEHIVGEFLASWPSAAAAPTSEQTAYATWLRTHESRLFRPPSELGQRVRNLAHAPLVSVIVPTYNTALYHLHRCIESVTTQLYPNWELCASDDASSDERVRQYLEKRAAAEPRIRLSFSTARGGISVASNRSITASTGEFIVLLDHDDELHPSALLEVARCLNAYPETDLIYSDEDKIDQLGVRSWPAFKPEFDQDVLRAFNYLGHLVAVRSTLVREVGGFRSDSDGAQDWDLLLRITSATTPGRIRHIPEPLYHWRMHEDSTAFSLDAKPYAIRAWKGVLERHLASAESCSVREGLFLGSMRILRRLPEDTRVSIVYRASDGPHQRRALFRSKVPRQSTFFEVILSTLHRPDDVEQGGLMTVDDLQSDVTVVVNCRIESVNHGFLEELASQALREDCGIVGATILRDDGTILTAGLVCLSDGTFTNPYDGLVSSEPGYMGQARVIRRVPSIGPHVFAFRTSRLLEANGLASISEDSLSSLCDLLVRSAHATGLRVLHTPYAIATIRNAVETYHPRQGAPAPRDLILNRNLEAFPSVTATLKVGIR
jgi:glycosyltransferase involved in cell wall biosynthesis